MKLQRNIQWRLGSFAGQEGFGIVEVLVAAVVLIIGVLATFSAFDAANAGTARARESQVALDLAQQEMEEIRALDYDQIALTSLPGFSSDTSDPRNRVSSDTFDIDKNPATTNPDLVVNGGTQTGHDPVSGGVINPGPEAFTNGDVSGTIYRFVVWQQNNGCPFPTCTGQDFKRVIIAVKPTTTTPGAGARPYIEVHSDFIDPQDSSVSDLAPDGGVPSTRVQFWLTDKACASTPPTPHPAPTGDHLLHNTLGTCANGPQTGTTAGAPDAMLTSLPTGDPLTTSLYDYSNDAYLEPAQNPGNDKGVQIQPQDVNGCNFAGTGTNPQSKVHRWLSDPMLSSFSATGNVSLSFFSKTINGVTQAGKVCVWVFKRSASNVDTQLTGSPFSYAPGGTGNWPTSFGGTATRFNMNVGAQTVATGQRLGIAISVNRDVTPASLEFMYDHSGYPTRLEVETSTPAAAP
jgi:type II secretory pathway pseudopilin PulG